MNPYHGEICMMSAQFRCSTAITIASVLGAVGISATPSLGQNALHPDAKPPIKENPYISYRDPWRWTLRSQLFLTSGQVTADDPLTPNYDINEEVITTFWRPSSLELVYPIAREGGFFWSPNRDVEVRIRIDDYELFSNLKRYQRDSRNPPTEVKDSPIEQKYVPGTNAEYTFWHSKDIEGQYRQLHMEHISYVVSADTVFNQKLARQLPWPEEWAAPAQAFLEPVVDSVGLPIPEDADEIIAELVEFWVGEGIDPKSGSQLDVVKFLTGKVIEYFVYKGPATEFPLRTTAGGRPEFVVTSNTWGGQVVRPAHEVALDPGGTRHDLAVLLTSVLRSVGVPARTVICINEYEPDQLLNTVSMVEFAMYDEERDQTFWVPIDVDRVRLSGARASQYEREWLYFGSHDELSHMVPISYYFHPPARYQSYDLPLLFGVRSVDDNHPLPNYLIQSLLVEPIMTPVSGNERRDP